MFLASFMRGKVSLHLQTHQLHTFLLFPAKRFTNISTISLPACELLQDFALLRYLYFLCQPACQSSQPLENSGNLVILPKR